ncbi:hypothetical protein F8388_006618 [Cannabis sativa]|uniref:Uncharacterized protein n=1 Tax=Cannabis sativa TaxID=3483 RepID=A0A7J6GUQ4_CANSA|nr:hypothetical protein F8388_006618 [Cannabis sativa]
MVFRLRFSAKLEILDAKTVFCVAKAALLQMINNQSAKEIYSRKQQYESISNRGSIDNHSGKGVGISSTLDVSDKSFGTDSILFTVELNAEKWNSVKMLLALLVPLRYLQYLMAFFVAIVFPLISKLSSNHINIRAYP